MSLAGKNLFLLPAPWKAGQAPNPTPWVPTSLYRAGWSAKAFLRGLRTLGWHLWQGEGRLDGKKWALGRLLKPMMRTLSHKESDLLRSRGW